MDKMKNIDDLFRSAREQESVYSFDAVKSSFIAASSNQTGHVPKNNVSLKKWIMTFTAITTLFVACIWIFSGKNEKQENKLQYVAISQQKEQQPHSPTVQPAERPEATGHGMKFNKKDQVPADFTALSEPIPDQHATYATDALENIQNNTFVNPNPRLDAEDPWPKLTEKEIAWAQKVKKQLLKSINKRDKKDWAYVPAGSFPFKESTVSCQSLFMLKYEVTNEQYLAFIYDLIIQERKADFQVAKPNQALWPSFFKADSFEPWQSLYFSHPAYQDYPVVNITVSGAQLFCDWLNTEYKKAYPKESDAINAVRLPQEAEWVMVASAIGKYGKYPWQGEFYRNKEGLILANFTRTDYDPIIDSTELEGIDITAPSKSYWPNDFGVYNLAGNVAEWVQVSTINNGLQTAATPISFRTIGGSFSNTEEFLRIHAKDPFEGVSAAPAIGFRIVMTHL